jgi:hypothetical protein
MSILVSISTYEIHKHLSTQQIICIFSLAHHMVHSNIWNTMLLLLFCYLFYTQFFETVFLDLLGFGVVRKNIEKRLSISHIFLLFPKGIYVYYYYPKQCITFND